jgi:hypothetical protein
MLGGFQIPVTEHFANGFQRDAVAQGNGCSESVPGNMESQVFGNSAAICNFLQVGVHLLITQNWQD